METRKFLSLVNKVDKSVDNALGKPTYSEECDTLNYLLEELSITVYKLTEEEYEKLKKAIKSKIEKVGSATEVNNKELKLLKLALGYLEFYTKCSVDDNGFSVEKEYDSTEFNDLFRQNPDWTDEQKKYFKEYLLRKELSVAYLKVCKETGCGDMYLTSFDGNELSYTLLSSAEYRLRICGACSISEYRNNHGSYKYFNYEDRDEEFYKQMLENCDKNLEFYEILRNGFAKMKEKGEFKGFFFDYDKKETEKFADNNIKSIDKTILKIKANREEIKQEYQKHYGNVEEQEV